MWWLFLLGCNGAGETDPSGEPDALTLDSCATALDAGTPAFFADLYRCVTVTTAATTVTVGSVGLPPHPSCYYDPDDANYEPFDTSRGADYHQNPNTLVAQDLRFAIPLDPQPLGEPITADRIDGVVGTDDQEFPMGPAGVALDGVILFNPLAAPGDDIEDEKYTFDTYNAHPSPDGVYHYHTTSPGPLAAVARAGGGEAEIYGMMCDGTVVLGCTEADASAPSDDLDDQGGHVHDIVAASGATWFAARYHVHVCEAGRRFTPEIRYYDACVIE